MDVEAIGLLPVALVPVRGPVQQEHDRPLRHDRAVELDVVLDVPRLGGRGRLQAQDLLDRARDQRRILRQQLALLGVLRQQLHREADQSGGGLVAGSGHHAGVDDDLVARQWAARTVRLVDLGVQQLGHEVIGGVVRAPLDVVGEHGEDAVEGRLVERDRGSVGGDQLVGGRAVLVLDVLGDAEQQADGPQGHLDAEVPDHVELVPVDQGIERRDAVAPDEGFEVEHAARREDARQQGPVRVVDRRILEEEDPRRHLHPGLDDLEHRSPPGAVRVPVEQRGPHVVPTAQREEAVLVVPVQRGLVPQPTPGRVRVVVDVRVVRVVAEHRHPPPCSGWFWMPGNSCSVGPAVTSPRSLVIRCGANTER